MSNPILVDASRQERSEPPSFVGNIFIQNSLPNSQSTTRKGGLRSGFMALAPGPPSDGAINSFSRLRSVRMFDGRLQYSVVPHASSDRTVADERLGRLGAAREQRLGRRGVARGGAGWLGAAGDYHRTATRWGRLGGGTLPYYRLAVVIYCGPPPSARQRGTSGQTGRTGCGDTVRLRGLNDQPGAWDIRQRTPETGN